MNFKSIGNLFKKKVVKRDVNIAEYLNTYEENRRMMLTIKKIATWFFIITYSYLIYDKIYQWYEKNRPDIGEEYRDRID